MKKILGIVVLGLLWCNVGFAECVEGNCISGQGTLIDNGHTYVGGFKDGKVHGQGNLIYPNGDKYVGEYQNGKRHGQGTFTKKNGDTYVGEWNNSMRHGQGTYTYANGDEYFGEYKKDKKDGLGIYTSADGDVTGGEFKEGKLFKKMWLPASLFKKDNRKRETVKKKEKKP
jgi:hypothetical protein